MLLENIESKGIFRIVNSKIGKFLEDVQLKLKIHKDIRVNTLNLRRNITNNQQWRKIDE